jgi:uncharacterized membrane protein YccC
LPALSAPQWLIEVARPKQVATPWLRMVRAPLAICAPLALGWALGHVTLGLPAALGGLISTVVERGGPYFGRIKRVAATVVLGNACGLALGVLVHGLGWFVVAAVAVMSVVSALISATGSTGSLVGLQMLLYTVLGSGQLAKLGPWWQVIGLFLAGSLWAVLLASVEWALRPRAPERSSIAEAYRAIARMVRAAGTGQFEEARQEATTALNTAYDDVLTARAFVAGRDESYARLVTLLNRTHRLAEAALTLSVERTRPLRLAGSIEALADSTEHGTELGPPPPEADGTPGTRALRDAICSAREAVTGEVTHSTVPRRSAKQWLREYLAELRHGHLVRLFAVRLALCMSVAAVLSEVAPLQRSYWVMVTVVVVLKPDFGSVFARALQRGIGTAIGAVLGAALLVLVPYGPPMLVVLAVLSFLVPYTITRNWGMFATLLTPLVLIIIDLPTRAGWQLAEARALDTLLGCALVLLLGYAPWPASWHADVGRQFGDATAEIARYLRALGTDPSARRIGEHRRKAYRLLSDVRTVFQRALSEPASLRRRTMAWYPAVVALERALDTIAAASVRMQETDEEPSGEALLQLADVLDGFTAALRAGAEPPGTPLPEEGSAAGEISDAVNDVLELFRAKS